VVAAPPGLRAPFAPGAAPIAGPQAAWLRIVPVPAKEQNCQVLAAVMGMTTPYWFEFPTPPEAAKSMFGLYKVNWIVAGIELALT
jgi:hypothetical protein